MKLTFMNGLKMFKPVQQFLNAVKDPPMQTSSFVIFQKQSLQRELFQKTST